MMCGALGRLGVRGGGSADQCGLGFTSVGQLCTGHRALLGLLRLCVAVSDMAVASSVPSDSLLHPFGHRAN